jgi:hypothetical protein
MKIRTVEVEFFPAYRQTFRQTDRHKNMTKLIVAFRNFADEVKKYERDIHLPVLHKLTVAQSGIH